MLTPDNILEVFEKHGLPTRRAPCLDFLPTDALLTDLTLKYGREFAIMFTISGGKHNYTLFIGTINRIDLPIGKTEILIKHTHPLGTPHPSDLDIAWLVTCQKEGSPQKQSVILPIGKKRITFNIHTPPIN